MTYIPKLAGVGKALPEKVVSPSAGAHAWACRAGTMRPERPWPSGGRRGGALMAAPAPFR